MDEDDEEVFNLEDDPADDPDLKLKQKEEETQEEEAKEEEPPKDEALTEDKEVE